MAHAAFARFLALVRDAKSRVRELTIPEYRERVARGERFILLDVREDREWEKGHLRVRSTSARGSSNATSSRRFPIRRRRWCAIAAEVFRSALVCENSSAWDTRT